MPRRVLLLLALTGALGLGTGCREDGLTSFPTQPPPSAAAPVTPQSPIPTTPKVSVPDVWLGAQVRELMAGSTFDLVGSAFSDIANTPATSDTTVAIAWRTDVSGAASIQALGKQRLRVRGEHAGTGWIEGRAFGVSSFVYLTVLDAAAPGAVSPIVVDDFRVVEHHNGLNDAELTYSPQIVLHDSTSSGRAAVIAASFEIPGLEPTSNCGMIRPASAAPRKVFFESYREFELNIRQPGRSANVGATVVAHLTIRLPNNTATTMTISGPVVSGPIPMTDDGWPTTADYLACSY